LKGFSIRRRDEEKNDWPNSWSVSTLVAFSRLNCCCADPWVLATIGWSRDTYTNSSERSAIVESAEHDYYEQERHICRNVWIEVDGGIYWKGL